MLKGLALQLNKLPTIGHDGFFSSYISAFRFLTQAPNMVQEGYDKYPGQAFKIPMLDRWLVVVSGTDMVDDIRKADLDDLSLREAFLQFFHLRALFGTEIFPNEIIQGDLTRNIAAKFPDMYDEMVAAFHDEIPLTEDWNKVPTLARVLNIVCRTSNRLLVGLPLCRDKEWTALVIQYSFHAFMAVPKTNLFPRFMHGRLYMQRARELLDPVVAEHMKNEKSLSDDAAEGDFLTWLIRGAPSHAQDPQYFASNILGVNFASAHMTSTAVTHALINLTLHPKYVGALRKEVAAAIELEGWSKAAMGRMPMLDSFLKESMRVNTSGSLGVRRVVLKDFTFSNGTVVPADTFISAPTRSMHMDENNYPNALEFDGLRFYHQREEEGESYKHQMIAPQPSYVAFGIGKAACPGRFFAVNEIKTIVAYVLTTYDLELDGADHGSEIGEFSVGRIMASKIPLMFRKRKDI
ncbi:hypothetical protein V5O48_005102 [Marasmius crinis-equi]|uniref:Cytochrome P450 n=1 Tax=Marasmius crinis-equi TaxID=585013 RepID=A0ABR3FNM4_9AGAR